MLQSEIARIGESGTFTKLANVAIRELCKSGASQIVCGPITSGGFGSKDKNLQAFIQTIDALTGMDFPIFNQVLYEPALWQLTDTAQKAGADFSEMHPILEDFYRPLFMTRRFKAAWFIPGWESSKGATWERNLLGSLGAQFYDLRREWWERNVLARFPYA